MAEEYMIHVVVVVECLFSPINFGGTSKDKAKLFVFGQENSTTYKLQR